MFARIKFSDEQAVTMEKVEDLEKVLCDKVEYEKIYTNENGTEINFYDWSHTIDPKEVSDDKKLVYVSEKVKLKTTREYIVELNLFLDKFPEMEISVKGMIKTNSNGFNDAVSLLVEAEQKFTTALKQFNEKVEFNSRCDVHIGNLGLLNINQLAYTTDKCTEELQNILNEGWRILAVCPQPDQRRPDYVLGRYNENHKSDMYCDHL